MQPQKHDMPTHIKCIADPEPSLPACRPQGAWPWQGRWPWQKCLIISLSVEADQPALLTGHCDGQDLQHWRMAMAIASAFFILAADSENINNPVATKCHNAIWWQAGC